ncbi:MAG: DNA polymerase III subunit beta [Oligoflexia bacterium]|nr:DNA polymerase III subunit beta [Oligoflexia bacterium]
MKITVNSKKDLLDSLNKVHSVVEKRNTLQILSNILLSASGSNLVIKATDLEVSVETTLPVEVKEEGKCTISAKNFLEIVKELPDKEIHIHSKDNHWVGIACGKSTFNIMGLPPEDFPSLPSFSQKTVSRIKVESLVHMIDHTCFAVSQDETRYHINGVYFEQVTDSKFVMVATDGARLSYYEDEPFEGNDFNLPKGIIIPRKGIQEIRKIIEGGAPTVAFLIEGNHLLVKTPMAFLSVRLIEGKFPDYKPVIPKNNSRSILLDKENLIASVARVSLLANEKSKGIRLSLTDDKLEISSSNPELGEAKELIETDYKGDPLTIGFNARYLQESLLVMKSETVLLELNDKMSPGLLRNPDSKQYLSVLMPMRL